MKIANAMLCIALTAGSISQAQQNILVVHEWGTITTQHRADGTPIGQLNRIAPSEVLPDFVHRYEPAATRSDPKVALRKGPEIPGRPDVTMRLETPVLYFYPPPGWNNKTAFDVEVKFRGGVINEFYPKAVTSIAWDTDRLVAKQNTGVPLDWDGKSLDNYVVGSLRWQGISLSSQAPLQATDHHEWLTPRKVSAAFVSAQAESERYLFYRGVAHLTALLQTRVSANGVQLRAPARLHWMPQSSMTIAKLWLIDVQADGRMALRQQDKLVINRNSESQALAKLSRFAPSDYTAANSHALRAAMKQQLLDAGLYDNEAEAMLDTWRDSYFKQPGMRVLYVVPKEWPEYFLPLRISTPHTLTRVLIGRIDLLSK